MSCVAVIRLEINNTFSCYRDDLEADEDLKVLFDSDPPPDASSLSTTLGSHLAIFLLQNVRDAIPEEIVSRICSICHEEMLVEQVLTICCENFIDDKTITKGQDLMLNHLEIMIRRHA